MDGFEQGGAGAGGGVGGFGHAVRLASLNGGFQGLKVGDAGLAALEVLLEFPAISRRQFAVEIFRERGEDAFAVAVRHW